MPSLCILCKDCKYPNSKTFYPEDSHGVPYCNSEGILSLKSREILVRKPNELKIIPMGPYTSERGVIDK